MDTGSSLKWLCTGSLKSWNKSHKYHLQLVLQDFSIYLGDLRLALILLQRCKGTVMHMGTLSSYLAVRLTAKFTPLSLRGSAVIMVRLQRARGLVCHTLGHRDLREISILIHFTVIWLDFFTALYLSFNLPG